MFALQQRAKRNIRTISLGLAVLVIAGPSYGQSKQTTAATFSNARSFLGTLYPELEQNGLTIDFTVTRPFDVAQVSEPRNFSVIVRRAQVVSLTKHPSGTPDVLPDVRLSASFSYDGTGRITRFSANAPWPLASDENEQIRKTVDAHPEWSDEKVIEQLRESGARFSPQAKDALLRQLPIAHLRRFLGELTVISAEFELRHENAGGEGGIA